MEQVSKKRLEIRSFCREGFLHFAHSYTCPRRCLNKRGINLINHRRQETYSNVFSPLTLVPRASRSGHTKLLAPSPITSRGHTHTHHLRQQATRVKRRVCSCNGTQSAPDKHPASDKGHARGLVPALAPAARIPVPPVLAAECDILRLCDGSGPFGAVSDVDTLDELFIPVDVAYCVVCAWQSHLRMVPRFALGVDADRWRCR
jgi:hypothetical protein